MTCATKRFLAQGVDLSCRVADEVNTDDWVIVVRRGAMTKFPRIAIDQNTYEILQN